MKTIFYIYGHYRNDTGELFYIGMGTDFNGTYHRSKEKGLKHRNFMWRNTFKKCNGDYSIKILHEFACIKDCYLKELELIKRYGKLINKSGGILTNLSNGGENTTKGRKKLIQYNIKGKPLKIWDDMYVAAEKYKVSFKAISQAINKKGLSAGYQWRWCDEDSIKLGFLPEFDQAKVKVHKYDLNGNYIQSYGNIAEAAKACKIDRSSITHCITGKRYSTGGFLWTNTNKANVRVERAVDQYDMNSVFIKRYSSLSEVVKDYSLPSYTAIRNCFTGKQRQAYGFIWKRAV